MQVHSDFYHPPPRPGTPYTIYQPPHFWWRLRGEHSRRSQPPSFLGSRRMGTSALLPPARLFRPQRRDCVMKAHLKLSNVVVILLLLSNLTIKLHGTWTPDLGMLFLITAPCWDGQGSSITCASSTLTHVSVPLAPRDSFTLTRESSFHEVQGALLSGFLALTL